MRRFIESGVALGVILILGGALFASLGLEREGAGAAWRAEFAQQAECVVGKYTEGCEKYSAKIDPSFYGKEGQVGVAPVGGSDASASYSAAGSGTAGQVEHFRRRGWLDPRYSSGPHEVRHFRVELGEAISDDVTRTVNFIYAREGAEIIGRGGVDVTPRP